VSRELVKHALVTGAAGAIGGAIAHELVRRVPGVRLTLVDVDRERAAELAKTLGSGHEALAWDLAQPEALASPWAALVDRRGAVDALVNCAGVMEIRSLCATPWRVAESLLAIDLVSPLRLLALAAPTMVERGAGLVVNVSSMAGVTPLRGCSYYGAAKAGLAMASEIAALELGPRGVHVVTVYPGPVRSGLERRARAQASPGLLTRLIPTGDAEPLARRVLDAWEARRTRVFYPSLYEVAGRLPGIAAKRGIAVLNAKG